MLLNHFATDIYVVGHEECEGEEPSIAFVRSRKTNTEQIEKIDVERVVYYPRSCCYFDNNGCFSGSDSKCRQSVAISIEDAFFIEKKYFNQEIEYKKWKKSFDIEFAQEAILGDDNRRIYFNFESILDYWTQKYDIEFTSSFCL